MKAFITGISGQDGSYLAELLLDKGYEVHGLIRRSSSFNTPPNLHHIIDRIQVHHGDVTDSSSLHKLILEIKPDEVYNLAAQSHVHHSFEASVYTTETNAVGVLNMLNAIKCLHDTGHVVKFYQASTSEMFGLVQEIPQNEYTPFHPRSPYGVSKLYGHWITINYRESYNLFACCGILFNHESPRRGETFVTQKIISGLSQIIKGELNTIQLGNLDALRDWGHAKDFVEGMWLMLQQNEPDDYILSTGTQYSVREFAEQAATHFGFDIKWVDKGEMEKGIDTATGKIIFEVNPVFYRPSDVNTLLGNSNKAREKLGWCPRYTLQTLISDMCNAKK